MQKEIFSALQDSGISFRQGVKLSAYTTFKIGGPAKIFCEPTDINQLTNLLKLCNVHNEKRYIIGRGSNCLFSDNGFDGVVIHIGKGFNSIEVKGNSIIAASGAFLSNVCKAAAENSLTGLEFAYGIPGSIGGAVYMNAGAYGGEMKNVIKSVTYIGGNGEIKTDDLENLSFGYRTSAFEHNSGCILSAELELKHGCKADILNSMSDFAARRVEKQPLDLPSAGSTFKRPHGAFAGALIEQCGLSGYTVGGAQISEKHCGFVVNKGGATCSDVLQLCDDVSRIVQEKTGFLLEREIRVIE